MSCAAVSDVPLQALIEHWEKQARMITEAGVPIERVAQSMLMAGYNVENDAFALFVQKAKDRMVAAINNPLRSEDAGQAELPSNGGRSPVTSESGVDGTQSDVDYRSPRSPH